MGFKNPYIEARRNNIQTLKRLIKKEGSISHKKAVAIMGMYGLRKKTITEYLETLQDAGFISFDSANQTWAIVKKK